MPWRSGKPVVLVPGNHEYYGCELQRELDEMRKLAAGSNVHETGPREWKERIRQLPVLAG